MGCNWRCFWCTRVFYMGNHFALNNSNASTLSQRGQYKGIWWYSSVTISLAGIPKQYCLTIFYYSMLIFIGCLCFLPKCIWQSVLVHRRCPISWTNWIGHSSSMTKLRFVFFHLNTKIVNCMKYNWIKFEILLITLK